MPFLGLRGGAGSGAESAEIQTPVLSPGESTMFSLAMPPSFTVRSVTVDQPARIRMYDTTDQRTADATRTPGVPGISGLIFEVIATAAGTYPLDPMPRGIGGYFNVTGAGQEDTGVTVSIDYAEV